MTDGHRWETDGKECQETSIIMPRCPLRVFGIWPLVWHVIERSSAAQVVGPSYRHIDNVFRFDLRDPVTDVSG